MPGKTHDEAFEAFAEPIRTTIEFVDPTAKLNKVWLDHHNVWRLGTPADKPIHINRGTKNPYFLALAIDVYAVPTEDKSLPWRMKTVRYIYETNLSFRGKRANRIRAWHWHPDSTESPTVHPHIHSSKNALHPKSHPPTGRVSIEEIVLFLIDDLDAVAADGCRDRLLDSLDKYEEHRNWNSARGAQRKHVPRKVRLGKS